MTCKATISRRKNGWPQTCARKAIVRGYCAQHAEMHPPAKPTFYVPVQPATRKCAAWIGCGNLAVPTADLSFRGFCPACEAVATGAVTQAPLF